MDAVESILAALPKVHRAGAERVARAARHAETTFQLVHLPPELRLARDHLLGGIPVGPFLFIVDGRHARPAKALTPHADSITDRPSATLNKIKEVIWGIDH